MPNLGSFCLGVKLSQRQKVMGQTWGIFPKVTPQYLFFYLDLQVRKHLSIAISGAFSIQHSRQVSKKNYFGMTAVIATILYCFGYPWMGQLFISFDKLLWLFLWTETIAVC